MVAYSIAFRAEVLAEAIHAEAIHAQAIYTQAIYTQAIYATGAQRRVHANADRGRV
jgi:hypothetical protein